MTALLEARGLSVAYGKAIAVREVDLVIEPGQIVTVIGPNGAGKSSLLLALMGALPSDGEVHFDGALVTQTSLERRVESGLALVPESRALFGEMSVYDNLILGGFGRRRDSRAVQRQRLDDVYKLFPRLRERATQYADTLSGGERQMLAVGRALIGRPRLLMLDEPSLGLAPRIVAEMMRMITRLRTEGISILIVEQNARTALQIADFGYVLEHGTVVAKGSAASLRNDPRVIDIYLGVSDRAKPAE